MSDKSKKYDNEFIEPKENEEEVLRSTSRSRQKK